MYGHENSVPAEYRGKLTWLEPGVYTRTVAEQVWKEMFDSDGADQLVLIRTTGDELMVFHEDWLSISSRYDVVDGCKVIITVGEPEEETNIKYVEVYAPMLIPI